MMIPDLLISMREGFLDLVSSTDRTQTLNPSGLPSASRLTGSGIDPLETDLAAELVDLLHRVIASRLVDRDGNVDYVILHTSPLYKEFRRCTRKLCAYDPSSLPDKNTRTAFWINL
jgi:hypothetical protein